jgi:hypothetical protein
MDGAAVAFLQGHLRKIDDSFQDPGRRKELVAQFVKAQLERSEELFGPSAH